MNFGDLMMLFIAEQKMPLEEGETQATRMIKTVDATLNNQELAESLMFMVDKITDNPEIITINYMTTPILMALVIVNEKRLVPNFDLEKFLKDYGNESGN